MSESCLSIRKLSATNNARAGFPIRDLPGRGSVRHDSLRLAIVALMIFGSLPSFCRADGGTEKQTVVVVLGAEGTPEFGRQFAAWAERWEQAAAKAQANYVRIGTEAAAVADRDRLREVLSLEQTTSPDTLWLILIGHGTFDGRQAKFNLRGPDVSAVELADWLRPQSRQLVVVNCAASSGPFINSLSAPRRVLITATKSGQEQNFARFGDFFSSSVAAVEADLDKDGQTSVLEAFLDASHRVAEFYDLESRLATEHPLLDDTADSLGTPADWFLGVRAVKRPQNAKEVDGRRARQLSLVRSDLERSLTSEARSKRDSLELELEHLRDLKPTLVEADYYERLEALCLQLAKLYSG